MLIAKAFDGYLPKVQIFQRGQFFFQRVMGQPVYTVIVTARVKMFKLSVRRRNRSFIFSGQGSPSEKLQLREIRICFSRK
jgi:hypothetical protein